MPTPLRTSSIDGEPCLFVIKNGNTTGVTIDRATSIFWYVREYFNNRPRRSGLFSPGVFFYCGNSGSLVVDGRGLLAGGVLGRDVRDILLLAPSHQGERVPECPPRPGDCLGICRHQCIFIVPCTIYFPRSSKDLCRQTMLRTIIYTRPGPFRQFSVEDDSL